MNRFERRQPYVTFLVFLDEAPSEVSIKETQPYFLEDPERRRQVFIRRPQYQSSNSALRFICPSGGEFWLAFGYDTVKDTGISGSIRRRTLPGLLVEFYCASRLALLRTGAFYEFGRNWNRNGDCKHGINCENPIENGCPNNQTVVRAMSDSSSEFFTAQIDCEDILGELVFTIAVRIKTEESKPPVRETGMSVIVEHDDPQTFFST